MRDFDSLTRRGMIGRLRALANEALERFGIPVAEIRFHCWSTNVFFRVRSLGRPEAMLRLATPGWRSLRDLASEALWLEALDRETEIPVPAPFRSRDDTFVVPVPDRGTDWTWHATLMTRQPGRLLGGLLTRPNVASMGALMAALHVHGASWMPPDGFTTRVFDRWLARGEPDLLFRTGELDACTVGQRALLERVRRRVDRAYRSLPRADLRVIHCDLWHDNIMVHRGRLCPFDFEDTVWGFRLHDIAMAMLDLLETVGPDRYPRLLSAFREAYERLLDWPSGSMDTLQAGRLLWTLNYVARFERTRLEQTVARMEPLFRSLEATGLLTPR